jgi:hypothetical protein
MATELQPDGSWQRVAAELRACREEQKQAWGDIDNATLGRYLAGEVNDGERRQVENALEQLPQLRELTDLVRDVLSDCDLGESATPQAVPASPAVLPFTRRSPVRRGFSPRMRQRSALLAAACLLLALGAMLLHKSPSLPPSDDLARARERDTALALALAQGRADARFARLDQLDRGVEVLEQDGKLDQTLALAPREVKPVFAASLNRLGLQYQAKGDLDHAEPVLRKAYGICQETLGPDAPDTVQTVNSLANVYACQVTQNPPPAGQNPYVANQNPYAANSQSPYAAMPGRPDSYGARSEFLKFLMGTFYLESSGYAAAKVSTPAEVKVAPVKDGPANPPPSAVLPRFTAAKVVVKKEDLERSWRDRLANRDARVKEEVVPVLAYALRHAHHFSEREIFARALGRLGLAAQNAAPTVNECLQKAQSPEERQVLLQVLREINPPAPAVSLPLIGAATGAAGSAAFRLGH